MESELFVQSITIFMTALFGLWLAFRLSKGRSRKRNITWGIITIFLLAPIVSVLFAWLIGLALGYFFAIDPLTSIAFLVILFPFFFFVGLGRLLIGLFRKNPGRNFYY